jgi:hypothetical protein
MYWRTHMVQITEVACRVFRPGVLVSTMRLVTLVTEMGLVDS